MNIEFDQIEESLGLSSMEEIDKLTITIDGIEIEAFDNYLLEHCYSPGLRVNPRKDRVCFVAKSYPKGTFPAFDNELNDIAPLFLCTYDIYEREIIREQPVQGIPLRIRWDDDGDFPVAIDKTLPSKRKSIVDTRREYLDAWAYMNKSGTINSNDPIHDPTRLEHYLFYYDERYCGCGPFEYASRMRNKYLIENDIPIPYEVPPEPIVPKTRSTQHLTSEEAEAELWEAYLHVNSHRDSLTATDPVYDPTRLEYYLFTQPFEKVDHEACEDAQNKRLKYLREHNLFIPYNGVIYYPHIPASYSYKERDFQPSRGKWDYLFSPEEAKEELVNAIKHVLSLSEDIPVDDPINRHDTLEHYLFLNYTDVISPNVCKKSISARNNYLQGTLFPIRYDLTVFDDLGAILSEIDIPGVSPTDKTPEVKSAVKEAPAAAAQSEKAEKGNYSREEKGNRTIAFLVISAILLGLIAIIISLNK